MTEQPGLFALPDSPSAAPVPAPRDRGRRGEHWTRTVVADLHIVDSRALRDDAHRQLSETITINLGPADDDPDLLDPHQEVATSNAAAVRWWIDPTTGIWPELAEALRIDVVDIDATDETTRRVRAHWSVTVTIIRHPPPPRPGPWLEAPGRVLPRALEPHRRPLRTAGRTTRRHVGADHRRDHPRTLTTQARAPPPRCPSSN